MSSDDMDQELAGIDDTLPVLEEDTLEAIPEDPEEPSESEEDEEEQQPTPPPPPPSKSKKSTVSKQKAAEPTPKPKPVPRSNRRSQPPTGPIRHRKRHKGFTDLTIHNRIDKASVRRLGYSASVKRFGGDFYDATRMHIVEIIRDLVDKSFVVAISAVRKTISHRDVRMAHEAGCHSRVY